MTIPGGSIVLIVVIDSQGNLFYHIYSVIRLFCLFQNNLKDLHVEPSCKTDLAL